MFLLNFLVYAHLRPVGHYIHFVVMGVGGGVYVGRGVSLKPTLVMLLTATVVFQIMPLHGTLALQPLQVCRK